MLISVACTTPKINNTKTGAAGTLEDWWLETAVGRFMWSLLDMFYVQVVMELRADRSALIGKFSINLILFNIVRGVAR